MSPDFMDFVGRTPAMRTLYEQIRSFAPAPIPVLVTGESGTGKQLVASSLHELSGVSGPCIAVNCAALSDTLIDSELFGHRKDSIDVGLRAGPVGNAMGELRHGRGFQQGVVILGAVSAPDLPFLS